MIFEKHLECLNKEQLKSLQAQKLRNMIIGPFSEIDEYKNIVNGALNIDELNCITDNQLINKINSIDATDKELYAKIDTEVLNRLDHRLFYIDSTSGSTGTPKSRYCAIEDDLHDTLLATRAFSSFGVKPEDRVLLYDLGDLTFYTQFTKAMQDIGIKNSFFYSARHDFVKSMEEAMLLDPTIIITLPSLLLRSFSQFTEILRQKCTVKKLIYFGEGLDSSIENYLNVNFNIECYSLYGSTDVGWLGAECEAHDGIHLFADSVLVNIENEFDTTSEPFKNCSEKVTEGEISFTSLFQIGKPNLRYKNGDRVLYTESICPCGRTSPRIKVLGRSAENFAILGMKVNANEIKEIVFGNSDIASFLQIELRDEVDFTIMNIRLPNSLFEQKDLLIEKLENHCGLNFYNQLHVLKIELNFVEESYFKKRKIPLVVDNRKTSI